MTAVQLSYEERAKESMIKVLRSTELRKSKPKHNNRLEEIVESYGLGTFKELADVASKG